MSNEATEEPFWRRPLPPIPGPNHREPEPVVEAVPEAIRVSPHEAAKIAEHALDVARAKARECRDATTAARAVFAEALAVWSHGEPIQTQDQALREYVNQSNADRAARVAAGQGRHYPGITRTANALSGGNAKQGGGASYKRGAYTRAQAMEIEAGKLRAAAAAAAAAKPRGK